MLLLVALALVHSSYGAGIQGVILKYRRDTPLAGVVAAAAPGAPLAGLSGVAGVTLPAVRTMASDTVLLHLATPLDAGAARQLAARLASDPQVAYAEPDWPVHPAAFTPTDPLYYQQWSLSDTPPGIRMPEAWGQERGAASIVVAVLDTGIIPHADIDAGRLLPGYDFITDPATAGDGDGRDPDPTDPGDYTTAGECGAGVAATDSDWHGLHVTGIIMASADNGRGIAGINHYSRILPVRVLGRCGGVLSDVLDAMRWAVGLPVSGVPANPTPARVLNLSFTADVPCGPAEQAVIDQVVATGAVVVAAAGNGAQDAANVLPASCGNVVTVAALDRSGAMASYTNFGADVTLSAPGGGGTDGIYSTQNTGTTVAAADTYGWLAGTSFATAEVTGVVSLMLSANPALTPAQVTQDLRSSVQPFPDASCTTALCGAGLLDAGAAVTAAANTPAIVPSASGGGGGGGCTLARGRGGDPVLAGILLVAWAALWRRGRQRR